MLLEQARDYAQFQRIVVDERNVGMADMKVRRSSERAGAFHCRRRAAPYRGRTGLVNHVGRERGYRISRP